MRKVCILLVSLTLMYHDARFRERKFRTQFSSFHAFCIAVHPAVLDLNHSTHAVSGKITRLNSSDEKRKARYRPRQITLVTGAACGTRIAVIVRSCLDPVPDLFCVLPMQVNTNFNYYCLLLQAPQQHTGHASPSRPCLKRRRKC